MAITPRTIFSSAAPATVAAVSLLAFTAIGTVAYMSAKDCDRSTKRNADHAKSATTGCQNLASTLGADRTKWSEQEWVQYARCFEHQKSSRSAIEAASRGLEHHPRSEPLYNIKGYHEIKLDRHADAVDTLQTGVNRVQSPHTGVLENNLAWAGLWSPRDMSLDRARALYRTALDREPGVCAYLHTGLWVEYATAKQASGVERFKALRAFDKLRSKYTSCLDRLERADWKTVAEIGGAAVMFTDLSESPNGLATGSQSGPAGEELLVKVAQILKNQYSGMSVDDFCSDAMPVPTTHQTCTAKLAKAIDQVQSGTTNSSDASPAAGGGGGPCPAMAE